MEKKHIDLWQKIAFFNLDDPNATLSFSKKLASEQKWTHDDTQRAIAEYKKFIFLAIVEPKGASPSHKVDEVWHLHITYTENYAAFCQSVLGRFLHHQPSKGGSTELHKHNAWYDDTLKAYCKHFETPPPPDLWDYPQYFSPESYISSFDKGDYSKKYQQKMSDLKVKFNDNDWQPTVFFWIFAAAILTLWLYIGNPFRLNGHNFLTFYSILGIIALSVVFVEEYFLNQKILLDRLNALPNKEDNSLIAWLLHGNNGLFKTHIVDLIDKQMILSCSSKSCKFNRFADINLFKNPLFYTLQCIETQKVTFEFLVSAARPSISLTERLGKAYKEIILKPQMLHLVIPPVIILGFARVIQGLHNQKPVGFLCLLILIIGIIRLIMMRILENNILKQMQKAAKKSEKNIDNLVEYYAFSNNIPNGYVGESLSVLTSLAAWKYAYYNSNKGSSASSCGSSSGGSSCSSSSGCGSSCGGGCGGCGGS